MKPLHKLKCQSWIKGKYRRLWCQWPKFHIGCHSAWDVGFKVKWNAEGWDNRGEKEGAHEA